MMVMIMMIMSAAAFMVVIVVMMLMFLMIMSTAAFMVVVMVMMFMFFVIMSTATFMIMVVIVMMMLSMFMYMSALRAYQRALGLAVFHQVTAASAVLSALLKAVNLGSSDPCERLVHRMHLPICRCRAELICVGDMFRHLCHIIIMISIDREQIVRVLFQRFFVFREIRKLRNLMILLSCFSQKCLALLDKEDKVLILRLRLSVSQIKFMWGDFLDHSFSPVH